MEAASFSGRACCLHPRSNWALLPRLGRAHHQGAVLRAKRTRTVAAALSNSASDQQPDERAFKAAAVRLQNLLSGVGDGEEELINSVLEEESPENKVWLSVLSGSLVAGGALLFAWVCGGDPTGGASLSIGSLRSGLLGCLAALPLVAAKSWLWSERGTASLPWLEALHANRLEMFRPVISNMSREQVAVVLTAEVVPTLLMALPAAQGCMAIAFSMYAETLRDAGYVVPVLLPGALALAVTSFLAAVVQQADLAVTQEEFDIVREAVNNSDRYYQLMGGVGPPTTTISSDDGGGSGIVTSAADRSRQAANAFRAVAVTWVAWRRCSSRLAAVISGTEIFYLGLLWMQTQDLTAPLVAGLLAGSVEVSFMLRRMGGSAGKAQQQAMRR